VFILLVGIFICYNYILLNFNVVRTEPTVAEQKINTTTSSLSQEQFDTLKVFFTEKFSPLQKELTKEMKRINNQVKVLSQQSGDVSLFNFTFYFILFIFVYSFPLFNKIYDEIRDIKNNDRDFVASN
jgi:hypothetical protein